MDDYEKPTGRSRWLLGLVALRELLMHRCLGIEEEAFTHNLCILGKSRERVNQKTILGAEKRVDREPIFTQN